MSFPFYGKMWIATKEELSDVILCEGVFRELDSTKDRNLAHKLIGNLYVRYIVLCNNLSELYDQTLQVQKREMIEKLLVLAQERLDELQKDIQKIEMSKFIYVDDSLKELHLIPQQIEFLRPFFFPRKRSLDLQEILDENPKVVEEEPVELTGIDRFRKVLTPEEIAAKEKLDILTSAVNKIKAHEKARQGRIIAFNMKNFPNEFKPPKCEEETFPYDFIHKADQFPRFRIKRTKYETNLYAKPMLKRKYEFYEPREYRINRLGHKVLAPKKKKEEIEEDERVSVVSEHSQKNEVEVILTNETDVDKSQQNSAAVIIQRNFLRYRLKKAINHRKMMKRVLYGMLEQPIDLDVTSEKEIHEKNQQKRRERKREFDEAFVKALQDEKAKILKMKSEVIMEDITDEIREWFRDFYQKTNDFDRYPDEFEGGTILVVRGETVTPEEFSFEKNKTKDDRKKEKEQEKKKKEKQTLMETKEKETKIKNELKKKALEAKEGPTWDFSDTENIQIFDLLNKQFHQSQYDWQFIDDLKNRKEQIIWDWVTVDAYCDVHKELRVIVDDLMRNELEILRMALALQNKEKYVKPKVKKEKVVKKKRIKSLPDLLKDRSLEECYEELKAVGLIKKYEKRSVDDFIGDRNYAALEFRTLNKNPPPHYGDIKNYIQTQIFANSAQIKSLCLVGPHGCGKKFLIDAICTEMDAIMFDLSAPIIKHIDDVPNFLNFVLQMAKKFQPSVIFIDGAHKPFIKKVPEDMKEEDPKKLGKFLVKNFIKLLPKEDAVVLIGATNEPWNCNFGSLKRCYEDFILFPPKLDYGTAVMAWQKGLKLKHIFNFDCSSLGQVSRKYTVGDILHSIDVYLDLQRRMILSSKPLTSSELFENLIHTMTPIDEKIEKNFTSFSDKIDPYLDERTVIMERTQIQIDKDNDAKMKEKQEMKKKVKK